MLAETASHEIVNLFYLITAVLFIVGLKALTSPRTARRGNAIAAAGMLLAVVGTLAWSGVVSYTWIVIGLAIGAAIGSAIALLTPMTSAPQMVSFFNGSGGLAAAMVAIAHSFLMMGETGQRVAVTPSYAVIAGLTVLIGGVSFAGSMVAVAKLQEWIKGRPIVLRNHHLINLGLLAAAMAILVLLGIFPHGRWMLVPLMVLAGVAGVMVVLCIGGADMPVVIAVLNSCTGLAAAATGFLLGNTGLIVSGALVGASGAVLTHLMCKAMNRPLSNVFFGQFGSAVLAPAAQARRNVHRYTVQDAQIVLEGASLVIIVPGYGLAVAQAQHACRELETLLEARGVSVKYAIHPVAGRMPGHMNVLLAEAGVPYEKLLDLEQSNAELEHADVALILGANDVVNPAARNDPHSPIYGMPILNVDSARTVIVSKRSLAPGFAGIDNELFYADRTMMIFGDAKATLAELVAAMKGEGKG
ncbi:MAG: NAD(P)(+) transhydrogenase (Re/Si-specific) subunit beta [Phycisphaerae bacterium]|jgi:NAD(P) transhydrogenase subunit beta